MGTFFVAILAIMFDGIEPARIPSAAGLSIFVRTICAGFATSITTTFWDRREAWHQSHLVQSTSAFDPSMQQALENLRSLGLTDSAAVAALNREVVGQAYLLSSVDYFWISAVISLALIGLVWIAKRPAGSSGAAAAE